MRCICQAQYWRSYLELGTFPISDDEWIKIIFYNISFKPWWNVFFQKMKFWLKIWFIYYMNKHPVDSFFATEHNLATIKLFKKTGRVRCGGSRETHWATCHNGVTSSKTKEFLKSSCFFKSQWYMYVIHINEWPRLSDKNQYKKKEIFRIVYDEPLDCFKGYFLKLFGFLNDKYSYWGYSFSGRFQKCSSS